MNWQTWADIEESWHVWALVWFFSAILGSVLALPKRRSVEGFWLCLLFGPLGVIIVLGFREHTRVTPVVVSQAMSYKKAAEEADFRALIAKRGKVGISFNERTVTSVAKGSPADVAGIRVGDRLILVDNRTCESSYKELLLQVTGAVGSEVNLALRRGAEVLEFTLQRK